ncbi:hypothetical protein [Absidia glauca]|uniref:Uncharacterized protein n=1 Tax=Absidia glauca TaxID=4829 RepID=A0A168PP76_ABSGL|nr:hypothetical protein [Absidia glauca]
MNNRDPIMNDEKFSLRFGNPIQVIHDSQPAGSLPTHHVDNTHHGPTKAPPPRPHNNKTRDAASFADFYHSKEGRVDEVDHE